MVGEAEGAPQVRVEWAAMRTAIGRCFGRRASLLLVVPLLLLAAGCDESGDTIVVNGLDCGLIRNDLFGDWTVTFIAGNAVLVNCEDLAFNGTPVDVNSVTTVYSNISVVASPSGASFDVRGSGPDLPNELMASVEADSCLALVQKWENDDGGWVQCIGTLDLGARAISASCDSMDLDTDLIPDGFADVACDLDRRLTAQVTTP